jgi:GTPase SAR1 family protein
LFLHAFNRVIPKFLYFPEITLQTALQKCFKLPELKQIIFRSVTSCGGTEPTKSTFGIQSEFRVHIHFHNTLFAPKQTQDKMGCAQSQAVEHDMESPKLQTTAAPGRTSMSPVSPVSQDIDHFMDDEQIVTSGQFKMLLLGTSDSGKSTIFRQLVNNYVKELTESDRMGYRTVVQHSTVHAMRELVRIAIQQGKLDNADPQVEHLGKSSEDAEDKSSFEQDMGAAVKALWSNSAIREVHAHSIEHGLHIPDNIEYFFDKAEDLAGASYVPSFDDIVRVRDSTKKANHALLEMDGQKIDLIDVGGQRGMRKKWIKHFDNVDCILFITSMSEFDQQLEEDQSTRRVDECLQVFDETCNLQCFARTSVVLFLNKRDLFEQKIKNGVKLSQYCPKYAGDDSNIEQAIEFYKVMYTSRINDPNKQVYVHVTCATDTSNVVFAFNAVYSIVINKILAERVNFM